MVNAVVSIRRATLADILELVRLRRMMFEHMGCDDGAQLDAADAVCHRYFAETIPSGEFVGWLAVTASGQTVGSGGIVIDRHPPGPGNLSGKIGYLMNVATEPAYRRQGIARRMMQTMLDWLIERDVRLIALHASNVGRSLYEQLGFVASNEMRLIA